MAVHRSGPFCHAEAALPELKSWASARNPAFFRHEIMLLFITKKETIDLCALSCSI
jgi:hypothetical protein